jgi:hypothetical protein
MATTTDCYCEDGPTFDPDYEFVDGEGFVCVECDSNVYYKWRKAR